MCKYNGVQTAQNGQHYASTSYSNQTIAPPYGQYLHGNQQTALNAMNQSVSYPMVNQQQAQMPHRIISTPVQPMTMNQSVSNSMVTQQQVGMRHQIISAPVQQPMSNNQYNTGIVQQLNVPQFSAGNNGQFIQ